MSNEYLICPHCGHKMKDYAFAKALRTGVGAVEKAGNSIAPFLFRYVGKFTGVKYIDKLFGAYGDKLASKKELVCHTIYCEKCHNSFQDR